MNLSRWDKKFAVGLIIFIFLGALGVPAYVYGRKYIVAKNKTTTQNATGSTSKTVTIAPPTTSSSTPAVPSTPLSVAPPKHSAPAKASTTTTNVNGTTTTTVSEGDVSQTEMSKIAQLGPVGPSPYDVRFSDETGQNAALENILKDYLNSHLKWGGEISDLYQITVRNAGDTGWEGQYSGSYTENSSGKIVSTFGYIILNTYYHQSDPNFDDYMKLVLSHEYGHHYSLYYKWMNLQLPNGTRFPDEYYNVRPLSKSTTAPDYSLGWGNCDAEIVAEDYSYFYSGYGMDAMAQTYGYPSAATKTWFDNLDSSNPPAGSSDSNVQSSQTPAQSTSPISTADMQNPTVTISQPNANPYLWNDGKDLTIGIVSSDNVGVVKLKIYINNTSAGEINAGSAEAVWKNSDAALGSYEIKVEAYDAAGNVGSATLTVIKS